MLPASSWLMKALLLSTYTFNRLTVDNNIVRLSHGGSVRGNTLKSEGGRPFYSFKGIPFAEPPLGELRFKAPVPKNGWSGEFDATKEGPTCIQMNFFRLGETLGQEDCLVLNVYTPQLPQEGKTHRKRDVLVYIHGGGFMGGSGASNFMPPERLMDMGNVLVAINYRVDALGFMSTGDEASPGNYGLIDQSLALQWVKDNIDAFGGNHESVTIIGHSAGGGSVSYHLITPLSKGLFHRAYPISGSALCPWAFEPNPMRWAKHLAEQTECPVTTSSAMVECLRTKPAAELVLGFKHYIDLMSFPLPFVPTVDGHFIDASPYEIFFNRPDSLNKVPVISGITEEEGSMFIGFMRMVRPNASLTSDETINYALNMSISDQQESVINSIKSQYHLSEPEVKADEDAIVKQLIKALSDGLFRMDHYLEVKALAAAGVPVYAFSYDYHASNFRMFGMDPKYGVSHGSDIIMYVDGKWFGDIILSERDRKMSKFLFKLLSNFAKTGEPDPTDEYHLNWQTSSSDMIHILKINETMSTQDYSFDNPNQKFWLDLKKDLSLL